MQGKSRKIRKDGNERKDAKQLCPGAPTRHLAFPPEETDPTEESKLAVPITITELVVLLNNWAVRTYPGVFRGVSNGLSVQNVVDMINYHHTPGNKGPVTISPFRHAMTRAMRACRLHIYTTTKNGVTKVKSWTPGLHQSEGTKNFHGTWDHTKLTLTGFRHDGLSSKNTTANVSFKSLAKGVKRFPSVKSGDGLNLTRYVQYAVANPQEKLEFPRDLKLLADRLGRWPIGAEHYDVATVTRWNLYGGNQNPPTQIITQQLQAPQVWPVNPPTASGLSSGDTQFGAAPPVQPGLLPQGFGPLATNPSYPRVTSHPWTDYSMQDTMSVFYEDSQQYMSPYASTSNSIAASETLQTQTPPTSGFGRPSDRIRSVASPAFSHSQDTAPASRHSGSSTRTHEAPVLGSLPNRTLATTNGMGTSGVRKRKQDPADDMSEVPIKKHRHDPVPAIDESEHSPAPGWTSNPESSFFGAFFFPPPAQYQAPAANVSHPSPALQLLSATNTAASHTAVSARLSTQFAVYNYSLLSRSATTTGMLLPSMAEPGVSDDLVISHPPGPVDPTLTDYSSGSGFPTTVNDPYSEMTTLESNLLSADDLMNFIAANPGRESIGSQDLTWAPIKEDLDTWCDRFFASDFFMSSSPVPNP
jgi:hypothetical protein